MHSFYRDPARRPMVMSSGAVACLAAPEMPCRKGRRSAASESCRLRRDEDARPHIARNSGLFTFWRRAGAHLRFSRKFWFGWQAAGRQAGFRSGRWRAQAAHSPFARGSRSAAQSGSAGSRGSGSSGTVSAEWDRLGARSSAMTKATTQPAVRAEGRSPRRARSPPAWRIETSLRRKRVRGGGSRRACGAKPSGVESRDKPAARQCARGKRERRVHGRAGLTRNA